MKIRSLLQWAVALGGFLLTNPALMAQDWMQTSAPSSGWIAIASSADGNKLVGVALNGDIVLSTNAGSTWSPSGAPSRAWYSVASSADGTKLVAGAGRNLELGPGGIYTSADSGLTWTNVFAAEHQYSIASSADGVTLLAAATLVIGVSRSLVSTNTGATWNSCDNPSKKPLWQADRYFVAVSANGTKLAAAASTGGIAISQDSGTTWTMTGAPRYSWTSIASSADGNRLVAATSGGGIYVSADGGLNWTLTSVPRSAYWTSVASSADGSRLVAVALYRFIYTSADSGLSWKASPPEALWQAVASSADGDRLAAAVYSALTNGIPATIYTLHRTPSPTLALQSANDHAVVLSWTLPSANLSLQWKAGLEASEWRTVTNPPVLSISSLQNQVTMPLPASPAFYRLQTP